MHRCLKIPEIVSNICFNATVDPELIKNEEDIPSRNQTLQAMSLTCRSFHEPSKDYIWSLIITLRPLVKCMAPDIWEETSVSAYDDSITVTRLVLRRPVLSSDMGKFMELARRVRTYGLLEVDYTPSDMDGRFDVETIEGPALCQALGSAMGGRCLFPNLRECFFPRDSITKERLQLLHLVLGPNVQYIRLHQGSLSPLDNSPVERAQFFVSLSSRCPQLKRIIVDDILPHPDTIDLDNLAVSELICASNYLTHVTVGRISGRTIQHLATLPNLKTFNLDLTLRKELEYVEERLDLRLPESQSPTFPALQVLYLESSGIKVCIDFFTHLLQHAYLQDVSLQFHLCKTSGWDQLLTRISAVCCSDSLTTLRIQDWSRHDEIVSQEPLRGLFRFSNLTELELGSAFGFDLDRSFIHDSAKTWVKLKSLMLYHISLPNSRPNHKVHITDLAAYAASCPELEKLALEFNARKPTTFLPRIQPHESLQDLYPLNSPLNNPAAVAAALSFMFPKLSLKQRLFPPWVPKPRALPSATLVDAWDHAFELVPEFVAVRRHERSLQHGTEPTK